MRKADDFVVAKSTKRGCSSAESSGGEESPKETPSKKAKRSQDEISDIFSFLRDGDKVASEMEKMRLDFEREKRAKDRANRKEELKLVLMRSFLVSERGRSKHLMAISYQIARTPM